MIESNLLERAVAIAIEGHKGQVDKYGAPYILHVLRVMLAGTTDEEKIVGVLHDIVEDTNWTTKDLLAEGFPDYMVDAIDSVSKRENEEYEDFVQRTKKNSLAVRVKLNDLRDNMDLRRVSKLSEEDMPRLNKYIKAYHELLEVSR
jgi:(p)ppGpp synthase/HD superfamily hydrolase